MKELVEFTLDDGTAVVVEVDADEPGIERVSRTDELVVRAAGSMEGALDRIRSVAKVAVSKLRGAGEQPHEIAVEFGIRLNAAAGAVIASTEAEGHLQVRLTWKKAPPEELQAHSGSVEPPGLGSPA